MAPILPASVTRLLRACPSCPGLFPSYNTLERHLRDHALLDALNATPTTATPATEPEVTEHDSGTDSPTDTTEQQGTNSGVDQPTSEGGAVMSPRDEEAPPSAEEEHPMAAVSSTGASRAAGSVVLAEELDPNYEPTDEEVREYAAYLGMDMDADRDLLWIPREGLKAPLLAPWKPCRTNDTQEIYYFNFATGESTWDHPCDTVYLKMFQDHKAAATDGIAANALEA